GLARILRRIDDLMAEVTEGPDSFHRLILEFFSTFRFGQAILDLDTPRISTRRCNTAGLVITLPRATYHIPYKGDLMDYWMGISSAGDFLGTAPSYTLIRDPILRLGKFKVVCLLEGKSWAQNSVGSLLFFSKILCQSFGLLTAKILGGLLLNLPTKLPIIDMNKACETANYAQFNENLGL
ncbi:hypothetical protein Tco_0663794, partial [Tanacetum coccineum]